MPLWGLATVNGLLAVETGWEWGDLDRSLLPLAYAGIGSATWAGLLTLRRYAQDERSLWIAGLSWAAWPVAFGTAYAFLLDRDSALAAAEPLVRTREWSVLAIVGAALSALVVAEGVRLGRRWLWTAGTAGMMGALLMGIAITEPGNVQAYTLPVGV